MISFLISAFKIIFLLGFLVFIHEGGHFLVAKTCKVKVNEFAIGFGPTILKWQGKETKYALRLIPLGGFVNMLGEEQRSDDLGSFSEASIPKRIAIVVAGAFVNIIFGILVYFILVSISGNYISQKIDEVIPNYAAEQAGILPNDEIIKINNKKIRLKSDIDSQLKKTNGEEITLTIKRNNEFKILNIMPTEIETKNIGIFLGNENEGLTSEVKAIYPNSVAQNAGLKEGDIILKIDDTDCLNDAYKVVELINESKNEKIKLEIKRNNKNLIIEITPEIQKEYKLGVIFKTAENSFKNNVFYGFWDTIDFSKSIIDNLKMLFKGNISVEQLTGPIGISEAVSKTQGIVEFVYLLALISLSLGITNLLPFPPLDGGKIVFLVIEAIRKKPLKEEIELKIQLIGFSILIALSIFVTYNDILRIF